MTDDELETVETQQRQIDILKRLQTVETQQREIDLIADFL